MNLFHKEPERKKNKSTLLLKRDFTYGAFSFVVLMMFLIGGIALQLGVVGADNLQFLAIYVAAVFFWGIFLMIFPLWILVVFALMDCWIALPFLLTVNGWPLALVSSMGLLLSASIELIYHWDKVVILRLGKFRSVHGPGLMILFPLLDRIAAKVDTRIKVTDFSAEKTITKDTVPVHVDALCFWMIWDAKHAILEVENYEEAVILSAQTALRDAIGQNDLATLLSGGDMLGKTIQKSLDAKTSPWGITILSVEFTDVIIPKELEDAMSRKAQAEREKQSRIILSEAEEEIASKFLAASKIYQQAPEAMQLRAMNMVYEGLRENKGSLVLLPSSALDSMNLGTTMGMSALAKQRQGSDNKSGACEKNEKDRNNDQDKKEEER